MGAVVGARVAKLCHVQNVSSERRLRISSDALTRTVDVVLVTIACLFFLPLILLIAALVLATDPGPIVFAQRRLGRGGRYFWCYKFRSMVVDSEERLRAHLATDPMARLEWERDHKLRNDPRITWLGVFLRKSSLDELPQLFNVLRGDMSLVGPRPIVDAEIRRYGRYFEHYCSVRPGITGLWQISGRNDVSYRRRVALDVAFSRSRSVSLHIKILAGTVPVVLLRKGSY
jgi:lipopolysaccharide/colanic/teichoic acid biosynthesis glycosyltransferase